jgi:HAD superfamily hydrolase (TIGR01509 family)
MSALLLDVDGTLVDSTYVHVTTWGQALAEVGCPVPCARIHRAIGMGAPLLLRWLVGNDAERIEEEATKRHRELFLEQAPGLRPLPGARELVAHCVELGLRVVLATSAEPAEREALLRALDLPVPVHAVTDAGDVELPKPEPDLVLVALQRAGARPDEAVMVGDARWDMEAARRAGVLGVGVQTGGLARIELLQAGAAEVFEDPAALLADLRGSVVGALLDR